MNKKLYYAMSLVLVAVGLLAGCTKNATSDWVEVDRFMVSLAADGTQEVVINVEASTKWTTSPTATWVKVAESENTLTVTAEENESVAGREAEIIITAGSAQATVKVLQVGRESNRAWYRFMTEMQGANISPSGKYVGAYAARVDESTGGQIEWDVYLIDLETNEQTLLNTFPQSLYDFNDVRAVTDQGIILLDSKMIYTVVVEENEADYIVPGFDGLDGIRITATSTDGSVWVGYGDYPYVPLKYVNGVPELLEMPETNFRGQALEGGVLTRGCSADGSMIYGSTMDNLDYGMLYWDKEGHVHWVGEDIREVEEVELFDSNGTPYTDYIVTGMQVEADPYNMSPNGRYIGGIYCQEVPNADNTDVEINQLAAVYDTVEGKTTVFTDYLGYGGITAVTDDGLALIATSMLSLYCQTEVIDLNTGENLGSGIDYVMDKFGLMLPSSHGLTYLPIGGKAAFGEEAAPSGALMWYWYVAAK